MRARAENAGLEGEGSVIPGGGLVDRRLDPGACVVQEQQPGVLTDIRL